MLPAEVLQHLRSVSLCLGQLYVWFEPADHLVEIRRRALLVEGEWNPEIDLDARKLEFSRHHADDLRGRVVEVQGAAYDIWIAAETTLPESITDNADAVLSGGVFAVIECAAERRVDTEDLEEVDR